ncbi:MAG: AraC family transcriptional regulator [Verrucomicrobiota bacterium]
MEKNRKQEKFLETLKAESWVLLLQEIPGACFFMKDKEGRYMGANRAYLEHMGLEKPGDLIGKRDRDFHPGKLSESYTGDDQEVMRSGRSIIDLVEPWNLRDGRFGWTITSKHPIYNKEGEAVGVVGFTRPREGDDEPEEMADEGEVAGDDSAGALQAAFLREMENPRGTRALFEHLPGVQFFIKDRELRFIAANQLLVERLGLGSEDEIVGTRDEDYFPPEVWAGFEEDDRQVLQTGEPIVGKMEQAYDEGRLLSWYITTKLPVYNRQGEVIGVMGVNRVSDDPEGAVPLAESSLSRAMELVRDNPDRRVSTEEMAKVVGMSVWQLRRRFRKEYGMSPNEFEKTTRIQGACQALAETDESIAEIAFGFGFCDQSAFTVQFRKQMGCTPKEYRKKRRR